MSITSTTFGTLCWNFCFTYISAYPWKRFFAMKIWSESLFLDISLWTSYATKNEPACEKKTHPSTTSRTSQAGLEMTKTSDRSLDHTRQLRPTIIGICPTIRDWTVLDQDRSFSTRRPRTWGQYLSCEAQASRVAPICFTHAMIARMFVFQEECSRLIRLS